MSLGAMGVTPRGGVELPSGFSVTDPAPWGSSRLEAIFDLSRIRN